MSLFSRTSFFDEEDEPRPPQTVRRLAGRQVVEEPVQKYGKTIVATDDLEGWYRELDRLLGEFEGMEQTEDLEGLRDSVYRYLR